MAHDPPSPQLSGDVLRRLRLDRGWSLRELSRQCTARGRAISHSQLGKIERGDHAPQPRTVKALSEVYGITVDRLWDLGLTQATCPDDRRAG